MSSMRVVYYSKWYSREDVTKILTRIEDGLVAFLKAGRYKDVLNSMSNLSHYSLNNQILLLLNNPKTTIVHGVRAWNLLGRRVIEGSKGMAILAPIIRKSENPDDESENGYKLLGYKKAYVFDVSQTTGEPLPSFRFDQKTILQDKDILIRGLLRPLEPLGFRLSYHTEKELGIGVSGRCLHQKKEIHLLEGLSDIETVSVLAHEAAHALAHQPEKRDFQGISPKEKRCIKEVEAESIACVVDTYLGLDTSQMNFSYILAWSEGEMKLFRHNLDTIRTYSQQLIDGIEAAYKEADKPLESPRTSYPVPSYS